MFRIELTNCKKFEFAANCPYYVIDRNRWYRTDAEENCYKIYELYVVSKSIKLQNFCKY